MMPTASGVPEVWGGFECSIVRIGDRYRNQIAETGHATRLADLDAAAGLGISKMRYPVLWEAISPVSPARQDWGWSDERLGHLRRLGVDVIAGLCHHGSGPRYTQLLDPAFPRLLAGHAARVARRYPWVRDFTPVNEPVTTARFSCLYGHWYPHRRSEADFLYAVFNQCLAIKLAMRSIRRVRPEARLVQTEDLGRIFGAPALAAQVEYENERRWLSFDLLSGRVDRQHPFFERTLKSGVREEDLLGFIDDPCPPDIVGINHYLTSDRYLDDDLHGYPPESIGGNGRQIYADVAAVRVPGLTDETGFGNRLREAWERYERPLALTEVHNGCTREEQLRWISEAWQAAKALRAGGIPVEGFTPWALAGAVDWSSLLTRQQGHYESGVFDIRSAPPRPTALARYLRGISGEAQPHPVLDGNGWWKRPNRYHRATACPPAQRSPARSPILITGKTGTLGSAFSRICDARGLGHVLLSRAELDIAGPDSVRNALRSWRPWAVVNTAGFFRVTQAACNEAQCMRDNGDGARILAAETARLGIPFVTFSSDLVFDGRAGRPYVENDQPAPRCVYGRSKAQAEQDVLAEHPRALIIRTAAFFGPWDRHNFAWSVLSTLSTQRTFAAKTNEIVTPTYVPDLVHAALDLLIDEANGLWHLTNGASLSWWNFARMIAEAAAADTCRVSPCEQGEPINTSLATLRGVQLPPLDRAIASFSTALR